MAYEELRRIAMRYVCPPASSSSPSASSPDRPCTLPDSSVLLIGALSKVIAATVTYPSQLIRARMQALPPPPSPALAAAAAQSQNRTLAVRYTGFWQALTATVAQEGVLGLYKGWVPTVLR
jgi:hypothetical protein